MARYYLSNSALELNETTHLLGFEDPNSFVVFFEPGEACCQASGENHTDLQR